MPLEVKDRALLMDMKKAAREAQSFVRRCSEAAFLADLKTQKAVERELEIIGEAARKLSGKAQAAYPRVPFRSIIGMRNLLAHDYGRVDPRELYRTVTESLPWLLKELR